MNVWSKLLTALRGGANEMGEAMVDSQALRILDQEIRDADLELRGPRKRWPTLAPSTRPCQAGKAL